MASEVERLLTNMDDDDDDKADATLGAIFGSSTLTARQFLAFRCAALCWLMGAGFALDWGEDESGLLLKFLRRGGGYYMSIGASELIAAGEVDVVSEECLGGV